MALKRSGLGKGLDGLLPSYQEEKKKDDSSAAGLKLVKLSEVEPNPNQPRRTFNEDSLVELSESMKAHGMVQPLVVVKRDDTYMIVAGERRWRAAKLAGLRQVPVLVKEYTDQEIVEVSLIENIQRENLDPIEEAQAYARLIQEFHMKQDELAERVSKSRTAITNAMRLLKLCPKVQQMVIEGMISAGHARALISIEDPDIQYETAMKVFDQQLNVRETEKLVKTLTEERKKKPAKTLDHHLDYLYEEMENQMQNVLGTKVKLHRQSDQKGSIEIAYYSADELERIYDLLRNTSHMV